MTALGKMRRSRQAVLRLLLPLLAGSWLNAAAACTGITGGASGHVMAHVQAATPAPSDAVPAHLGHGHAGAGTGLAHAQQAAQPATDTSDDSAPAQCDCPHCAMSSATGASTTGHSLCGVADDAAPAFANAVEPTPKPFLLPVAWTAPPSPAAHVPRRMAVPQAIEPIARSLNLRSCVLLI